MTKTLTYIITPCLVLILLSSCLYKQTEKEFEESVFYEIVPSLIDSLNIGINLTKPPPPMPIFDNENKLVGIDSTGVLENNKEYEKRLLELKSDSINIAVSINKIAFQLDEKTKNNLVEHFENEKIEIESKEQKNIHEINIDKLNIKNQVFKLKYESEIPENLKVRKSQKSIFFNGKLNVSKITFDKTKSFGILSIYYDCGRLCGATFDVFINKIERRWKIEEIIYTSVE